VVKKEDLETPIDPDIEYFDATEAIKAIEEGLRQLSNRMVAMEKLFELQGTINGKLLENMNHLLIRIEEIDTQPKSSLILPEHLNS
jgi:hypothetical protein